MVVENYFAKRDKTFTSCSFNLRVAFVSFDNFMPDYTVVNYTNNDELNKLIIHSIV